MLHPFSQGLPKCWLWNSSSVLLTMALFHPFTQKVIECLVFLHLCHPDDWWFDVIGFEPSGNVASSSTLQIFREASLLWWMYNMKYEPGSAFCDWWCLLFCFSSERAESGARRGQHGPFHVSTILHLQRSWRWPPGCLMVKGQGQLWCNITEGSLQQPELLNTQYMIYLQLDSDEQGNDQIWQVLLNL